MPQAEPALKITDIHSHFVPGVDDGAASVSESLEALGVLRLEGVVTVVTTPHLLVPFLATDTALQKELDRQRRAFDDLMAAWNADEHPALGLGQEIWAPDAATVRRVVRHPGVGLEGTRFLLVEFGFDLLGMHTDVIDEVVQAGREIIISHPERYHFPQGVDPLDYITLWRDVGAWLQMNVGSLSGHYRGYSPDSESLAWQMLELALVDIVATDHHGPRRSGVSPREGIEALTARGFQDAAERLFVHNPGCVVRDELPERLR